MSKKKILSIVAFVALIVPSLLLLTGCPQHIDSLYGLKVTGDGTGGAIALYEDKLGGNIHTQKISSDGKPVWGENGVLLGASDSKAYSFFNLNVVSDSSGGAIVVWPDLSQFRSTSHLARIDAEGKILWQRGFVSFNRLISDGSGGAIIAFDNYPIGDVIPGSEGRNLLLVKIDSQGSYPWGLQGVTVPRGGYQDNTLQMTHDGSGGAIVVWEELEPQAGSTPGNVKIMNRLFAQRIDYQGKLSWGQGVLLYATPEGTYAESPQIADDGSGGAVFVWHQVPNGKIEGGSLAALMMDVLAQKVNASGKILWQPNGVPLGISQAAERALAIGPLPISDGAGGTIIVWRDMRNAKGNTANLYAQRIDTEGNVMWQPGGVNVSIDATNPNHMIISGDTGGAIVSYLYSEPRKDLHVQKLGVDGNTVWPENGILVVGGDCAGYSIASDGQGGVITGWGVGKSMFSSEKAYVQRVSADGELLWGEGIRLNK